MNLLMAGYVCRLPQKGRLPYTNLLDNWSYPHALRSHRNNALYLGSSQLRKLHAFKVYEDPDGTINPEWEWKPEQNGDYICRDVGAEPQFLYRGMVSSSTSGGRTAG